MDSDKFSIPLKNYLQNTSSNIIEVIVELGGQNNLPKFNSNRERIDFKKESFVKQLNEFTSAIKSYGGNVIDSAWINKTMKVKIPISSLENIAKISSVELIDIPHKLKAE